MINSKNYLLKTNIIGVFAETLTAQIDAVLPDETVPVRASSAVKQKYNY